MEGSESAPVKRIAIIGAGIFVRETYLPNIEANYARCKLVAILSRTSESVDDALSSMKGSSSGSEGVRRFVGPEGEEQFFAQARDLCDAVIICVPIPLLGKYVERCLEIGIHVLSEKPVAVTSDEARRLISRYRSEQKAASSHGGGGGGSESESAGASASGKGNGAGMGFWHVAENYRLEPAVTYARDLVRRHSCPPKSFTLVAFRQQSSTAKFALTPWRAKPEYQGSFVLDGGIHFVALLRTIVGAREATGGKEGGDKGAVSDIRAHYEEHSTWECGTCGSCNVAGALGTFHIRYGAFLTPTCRLDVYFDDAILNIVQIKGVGYQVTMNTQGSAQETRDFPFAGLEDEFKVWLDTLGGVDGVCKAAEAADLAPEEGLIDLLIVEEMCRA